MSIKLFSGRKDYLSLGTFKIENSLGMYRVTRTVDKIILAKENKVSNMWQAAYGTCVLREWSGRKSKNVILFLAEGL